MATNKRSGPGGLDGRVGIVGTANIGQRSEADEGRRVERQGDRGEDDPKAPWPGDEDRDGGARRVGSARVGDEEDLDQGLDRLANGNLDDGVQRLDPALDADIEGGE